MNTLRRHYTAIISGDRRYLAATSEQGYLENYSKKDKTSRTVRLNNSRITSIPLCKITIHFTRPPSEVLTRARYTFSSEAWSVCVPHCSNGADVHINILMELNINMLVHHAVFCENAKFFASLKGE